MSVSTTGVSYDDSNGLKLKRESLNRSLLVFRQRYPEIAITSRSLIVKQVYSSAIADDAKIAQHFRCWVTNERTSPSP